MDRSRTSTNPANTIPAPLSAGAYTRVPGPPSGFVAPRDRESTRLVDRWVDTGSRVSSTFAPPPRGGRPRFGPAGVGTRRGGRSAALPHPTRGERDHVSWNFPADERGWPLRPAQRRRRRGSGGAHRRPHHAYDRGGVPRHRDRDAGPTSAEPRLLRRGPVPYHRVRERADRGRREPGH